MPKNRILPSLGIAVLVPLLAWAQDPAPTTLPATDPTAPTEAEAVIDEAIAKIRALTSVSAKIDEKVQMLGQRFRLSGTYLKGTNHRVSLRLDVTGLADNTGSMLQVCDGATLWELTQVLQSSSIRRFQIDPVLKLLESPDADPDLRDQVMTKLGFAGPEALLVGLRKAIAFNQKRAATLDGKPVWVVAGRWSDRAALGQPEFPATSPLPPFIPSIATVWIGQEDGWPYQVRLEGRAPSVLERKADGLGAGAGAGLGSTPLPEEPKAKPRTDPTSEISRIIVTFTEVALDPDLPPASFAYTPPENVTVVDGTQEITTQLENALNERAAQKRAEAAKAGGELDQSLIVPSPDTPPSSAPNP